MGNLERTFQIQIEYLINHAHPALFKAEQPISSHEEDSKQIIGKGDQIIFPREDPKNKQKWPCFILIEYKRIRPEINPEYAKYATLQDGLWQIISKKYIQAAFHGRFNNKWNNILLLSIAFYHRPEVNEEVWAASIAGIQLKHNEAETLCNGSEEIDNYSDRDSFAHQYGSLSETPYSIEKFISAIKNFAGGKKPQGKLKRRMPRYSPETSLYSNELDSIFKKKK